MTKLQLLAEHLVKSNSGAVDSLAIANGYKPGIDFKDKVGFIFAFVNEKKAEALEQLAKIHPDRELIIQSITTSNADGATEVINVTSATGDSEAAKQKRPNLTNLLMLVVMVILLIAILNGKI